MEQSPSREANSHSATPKYLPFMESKGSLQCSQQPTADP